MLSQFQAVGQALFTQGLVLSQAGNLSIKLGEQLVITHRGSTLGSIQARDLVETGINKNNRATPWLPRNWKFIAVSIKTLQH